MKLPFFNVKRVFSLPPNATFPLLYDKSRSSTNHANGPSSPLVFSGLSNSRPNSPLDSSPPRVQSTIITCPGRFYELFSNCLESIWVFWELMLIGETILVTADSPKGASDCVFGLLELIKPMPWGGDYRPYFTIQDSDFKIMTAKGRV